MQLQMTAPLDIGLELQDATLHNGQDDVFDLDHAQKELRKRGGIDRLADETGSVESDSDDDAMEEDEDIALDSEEERERKVAGLEEELDGMYDAYQERMKDRDTKYRVKEARRKDKAREEWHGIQKKDSDDEDTDEEGGWEEMEDAKARVDEYSDSESDIDDDSAVTPQRKRIRMEDLTTSGRKTKKARLSEADPPVDLPTSRASKVWFDQDIFAGMETHVSDKEEEDDQVSDDEMMVDAEEQVDVDSTDEGFEVVPQDADVDAGMWDVEDENLDEIKQAKIKSELSRFLSRNPTLAFSRTWSTYGRSRRTGTAAGQQTKDQNTLDKRGLQPVLIEFQRWFADLVLG